MNLPAAADTPRPESGVAGLEPVRGAPPDALRVVVVDPETAFTRVLSQHAARLGWDCAVLTAMPTLLDLVEMEPQAVLVDPGAFTDAGDFWRFLGDGILALPLAALLVISADSTVALRVRGLRLGADDWIAKPAHPDEVMARVHAVVRRRSEQMPQMPDDPMVAGELEIRPDRFQAYVAGQSIGLTRREYELLAMLAYAEGRVLEREEIYQRVWGYSMVRGDRSVDVFVGKIRGKLAARSPAWRYVHTHIGVGYRFDPEPAPEEG